MSNHWLQGASIQVRLMVLTLAVALPFAALVLFGALRANGQSEIEALERAAAHARLTAACVDDQVIKVDSVLASLGSALTARPEDAGRAQSVLSALRAQLHPAFGPLRVSDATGSLVAGLNGANGSIADRRYFQRALATSGLAVGEATRSFNGNEWTLGLARRIVGESGMPAGVVSVTTRLAGLQGMLDATGLPAGAVITLIDEQGVVLAHTREFATWVGRKLEDTAEFASGGGNVRAASIRTSADGAEWLSSVASLSAAPWRVHVSIPANEALGAVRRQTQWLVGLTLACLLFSFGLAWRVGRGLSAPLRALAGDARRLGDGDTAHRSAVSAGGEMGVLAGAINRLADQSVVRLETLRDGEAKFRAMVEASPVGIWTPMKPLSFAHFAMDGSELYGASGPTNWARKMPGPFMVFMSSVLRLPMC